MPAENFEDTDFGPGPRVGDRLYQGPFPQYRPQVFVPDSTPLMATWANDKPNRGFGKGLINLQRHVDRFPDLFREIAGSIGYRIRPTLIWVYVKHGRPGLVVGLANDGVAAVPGALRISVEGADGKQLAAGSLDPGLPLPGKIRQAELQLKAGDIAVQVSEGGVTVTDWRGVRLRAELEVKGKRYPVIWACTPTPNPDGTLTLQSNIG